MAVDKNSGIAYLESPARMHLSEGMLRFFNVLDKHGLFAFPCRADRRHQAIKAINDSTPSETRSRRTPSTSLRVAVSKQRTSSPGRRASASSRRARLQRVYQNRPDNSHGSTMLILRTQ